jgi:hypothetical protein
MAALFGNVRTSLLLNSGAQMILLGANLLLLVNFARTACAACCVSSAPATNLFRQPASKMEAHAS